MTGISMAPFMAVGPAPAVQRAAAPAVAEATKLAAELAHGPKALGLIRNLLWRSLDAEWPEQLTAERETQAVAGRTADFIEGVQAFLQKRPANFTGR